MRKQWTASEQAELVRQRRAGAKIVLLAARFGRSPNSIKRRLQHLGVIVEPWRLKWMRRKSGELKAAVRKLLNRGESVTSAAELLGVSHAAVSRVRRKLGIPPATYQQRAALSWQWRRAKGAA